MREIAMRDVSRSRHVLGGAHIEGLPDTASIRVIVQTRIRAEVAAYNADPGPMFTGMVQPSDSVRHSAGYRMRAPRPLEADRSIAAVEEAVEAEMLAFHLDDRPVGFDEDIEVAAHEEIVAVFERPVVVAAPDPG